MSEKVKTCPLSDWPTADRSEWERACVAGQRLKPGGAVARMKPSTRTSLLRAYGYLFDFCRINGLLNQKAEAGAHMTPEIIDAFLRDLHGRVGSVTRASYIGKIRRIARILAPRHDFAWLGEVEADLRYEARPRPKYHRIVSSERLLALGLELISRGETSGHLTDLARARLVRDGLMVALLALCPIRLRNFAELRIGRQIRRIGETWWIILEAAETKSGRPDERPIPGILTDALQRWVDQWRPVFHPSNEAFWPSIKGGSLAYTYVGQIITETTLRELRVAVNPHLFRDCAVYTVATVAGDRMGIASGFLQHTDPRTTEKDYNKGASVGAVRRYQQILDELMSDLSAGISAPFRLCPRHSHPGVDL
jgi:integrase